MFEIIIICIFIYLFCKMCGFIIKEKIQEKNTEEKENSIYNFKKWDPT